MHSSPSISKYSTSFSAPADKDIFNSTLQSTNTVGKIAALASHHMSDFVFINPSLGLKYLFGP